MKIQRLERLLLAIGLVFLTASYTVWFYGTIASHAAIKDFHASKPTMPNRDADSSFASSPDSLVDFRLWSIKRIRAYGESLSRESAVPLAILRIPRVDLEAPIFDGTDDITLDRGVGRILGTATVGQSGNLGIAGHRDGFFRGLKDLKPGDAIELDRRKQSDRYIVSHIQIVEPNDVSVLAPTMERTLTLVTCFPFYYIGSAPKRYIVTASIQYEGLKDKGILIGKRNTND